MAHDTPRSDRLGNDTSAAIDSEEPRLSPPPAVPQASRHRVELPRSAPGPSWNLSGRYWTWPVHAHFPSVCQWASAEGAGALERPALAFAGLGPRTCRLVTVTVALTEPTGAIAALADPRRRPAGAFRLAGANPS
jgi:hypothetical protein